MSDNQPGVHLQSSYRRYVFLCAVMVTCPCCVSLSEFVKCKEKIEAVSCGDDTVTLLSDRGHVLCVDTAHTYMPR